MRPTLPSHSDCHACTLREGAKCPGMPTVLAECHEENPPRKAVLLLGKAPTSGEDATGLPFSGVSGIYVNSLYIQWSEIYKYADVYLNNAVRCRLPNPKMTPGKQHWGKCRVHLQEDIRVLREHYDEVVVLATGADAVGAVLGHKVALSKFDQGCTVDLGGPVRVFSTYLPAVLEPGIDPSKGAAVEQHLLLLRDYLRDGELRMEVEIPEVDYESRIPPDAAMVSLDIETYGALNCWQEQRFFHPAKSMRWDKVPAQALVVSAACAWRDPTTGELRHRYYGLDFVQDCAEFYEDLKGLKNPVILGQNLTFDVMYLRAWDKNWGGLESVFEPFGKTRLIDLAVLNFLENDQRPERSLKSLSRLLRTYDYSKEEVRLGKGQRYADANDPRLHKYNVVDAVATLRNYEILQNAIQEFRPNSHKGDDRCLRWYSDLLWLCIDMGEQGIAYDEQRLRDVEHRYSERLHRVGCYSSRVFGGVLAGTGTKKYVDGLAVRAATELLPNDDPRLKRTEIAKNISSNEENFNLFLGECPRTNPLRKELRAVCLHRKLQKMLGTYLHPLLGINPPKNPRNWRSFTACTLIDGVAYPQWYPVPSQVGAGSAEQSGGTQQARITSKSPAVQTQPPLVESCQRSRHPNGGMIHPDESQVELRVAAMYSHDRAMIQDYESATGNRHASTASLVAGFEVSKKLHPQWYHAGKTLNFLTLFSGGAKKFRETLLRNIGLDLPVLRCQQIISAFDQKHPQFRAWQSKLVAGAKRSGFVELPVFGISRTFLGGDYAVDRTYVPTITNFPIQCTAALLTLSAQVESQKWLRANGFRCRLVSNTYDEGVYDCPVDEVDRVLPELLRMYRGPELYSELVEAGLYPVPLDCEVKVCWNKGG